MVGGNQRNNATVRAEKERKQQKQLVGESMMGAVYLDKLGTLGGGRIKFAIPARRTICFKLGI